MARVIERQDRGKNCPAAIFTPRQPDVSLGPLGTPTLHQCNVGVALDLVAQCSATPATVAATPFFQKRLVAPCPIDLGASQDFGGLYHAIRVAKKINLASNEAKLTSRVFLQLYHDPKIYAVKCKLFWEYLRYAIMSFGSKTILLHAVALALFSWDSRQYAFAIFKRLGTIYFVQLLFFSFSDLILLKMFFFWGGGGNFRNPQPPLLLTKKHCNPPPACIAVLSVPLTLTEGKYFQHSSHLYRGTPPILLQYPPCVSQCFWDSTGGWGHQHFPRQIFFRGK